MVDFPLTGPAIGLVSAMRLLIPVLIGAGAAGLLMARGASASPQPPRWDTLPAWRPAPALAGHLVAFVATAIGALRLFGPGAPPVTNAAMLTWMGAVLLCLLLAARSAVPLGWLARFMAARWRVPLLAVAAGMVTWTAAEGAERLWGALSGITLRAVSTLLSLVSDDVFLDPAARAIGIHGFGVTVAPVCSGADGIGLVVMFQALWIAMARSRLRVGRAALLLPIGALAALAANVLRIAVLLVVGAAGHEELAMGGLHSKLGWLLFIAIALASVAAAERIPWLQREAASGGRVEAGLP
ncbi:MAG: archaeosortase/exosortase family protein, partial [Anaeromyxobacteraceae bacterium]